MFGKDPLYVADRFDLMKWWRGFGKEKYNKLYISASILLAKPAHNGYQEWVFSIGTYCNGPLRQKLKPDNFEMRVLDSINGVKYEQLLSEIASRELEIYGSTNNGADDDETLIAKETKITNKQKDDNNVPIISVEEIDYDDLCSSDEESNVVIELDKEICNLSDDEFDIDEDDEMTANSSD